LNNTKTNQGSELNSPKTNRSHTSNEKGSQSTTNSTKQVIRNNFRIKKYKKFHNDIEDLKKSRKSVPKQRQINSDVSRSVSTSTAIHCDNTKPFEGKTPRGYEEMVLNKTRGFSLPGLQNNKSSFFHQNNNSIQYFHDQEISEANNNNNLTQINEYTLQNTFHQVDLNLKDQRALKNITDIQNLQNKIHKGNFSLDAQPVQRIKIKKIQKIPSLYKHQKDYLEDKENEYNEAFDFNETHQDSINTQRNTIKKMNVNYFFKRSPEPVNEENVNERDKRQKKNYLAQPRIRNISQDKLKLKSFLKNFKNGSSKAQSDEQGSLTPNFKIQKNSLSKHLHIQEPNTFAQKVCLERQTDLNPHFEMDQYYSEPPIRNFENAHETQMNLLLAQKQFTDFSNMQKRIQRVHEKLEEEVKLPLMYKNKFHTIEQECQTVRNYDNPLLDCEINKNGFDWTFRVMNFVAGKPKKRILHSITPQQHHSIGTDIAPPHIKKSRNSYQNQPSSLHSLDHTHKSKHLKTIDDSDSNLGMTKRFSNKYYEGQKDSFRTSNHNLQMKGRKARLKKLRYGEEMKLRNNMDHSKSRKKIQKNAQIIKDNYNNTIRKSFPIQS
jgi:hypothetical protein